MRRTPFLVKSFAIWLASAAPSAALAADVQWTLEGDETIVNAEVGSERWTITYRLADGRAIGNVHHADGAPPSFVQCNRTGIDGDEETFQCFGAEPCMAAPCADAYSDLGSVSLNTGLFVPPGTELPPSAAVRETQELAGTWRFEVAGTDPISKEFRFDPPIRQGNIAEGIGPFLFLGGTANVSRVLEAGSETEYAFVASDVRDFAGGDIDLYAFNFGGGDRIEGSFSSGDRSAPFIGVRVPD